MPDQPTHPIWQQAHFEAPIEGDVCPNGYTSGKVTAKGLRLAANAISLDGAHAPIIAGTKQAPLPFAVKLGRLTEPTDPNGTLPQQPRPYQLVNDVVIEPLVRGYTITSNGTIDEFGVIRPSATGTGNGWYDPDLSPASLLLVSGTEFLNPSPDGGFALAGVVTFSLTAKFDC